MSNNPSDVLVSDDVKFVKEISPSGKMSSLLSKITASTSTSISGEKRKEAPTSSNPAGSSAPPTPSPSTSGQSVAQPQLPKASAPKTISSLPNVAPAPKKPKTVAKKNMPHALIWVCHAGNGGRSWTGKNLKIVGVYGSKEAAEQKKCQVMDQYMQAGHGDIIIGDSWEDEIDLLVRPCGECIVD